MTKPVLLAIATSLCTAAWVHAQTPLPADEILKSWESRANERFATTQASVTETRTEQRTGNTRVSQLTQETHARGDNRVVVTERSGPGNQFRSRVYGVNDQYAFELERSEPEGAWQVAAIDVEKRRMLPAVQKHYGYAYFWADQAEFFVGLEGLPALARDFPRQFTLTAVDGSPGRYSFHFQPDAANPPLSRMETPIPELQGMVDVAAKPPHSPIRIEWRKTGENARTSTLTYEDLGAGEVQVTESNDDSGSWKLNSVGTLSRSNETPDREVFYLSHYGLPEPNLESSGRVNGTIVLLVVGGTLLAAFVLVARRRSMG